MTVKELIQELLECDMESEVCMKIKFSDTDYEYEDKETGVEIVKMGTGWGKNVPYITLDLERYSSEEFADEIKA